MHKPKVGDIVFSLNVGNAARGREQKLTKCEVVNVGRKYFEISPVNVEYKWVEKFHIDSWSQATNYSADHRLYESEQQWIDEKEIQSNIEYIRNVLGRYGNVNIDLESSRKIVEILKAYKVEK